MSYTEIAGSRRSTPNSHSVEFLFDDLSELDEILVKGSHATWAHTPAVINSWTVKPYKGDINSGGTVLIQAVNDTDAVNLNYNPTNPENNVSCTCSDSNIFCRKEWWGVRRATAEDLKKPDLKNINGENAKKGELIYINAPDDTDNNYQGSPNYEESPFLGYQSSNNIHPATDWIEKNIPTKTVQISFYSEKKMKNFYHLYGIIASSAWPNYVKEFLWDLGYPKWRYVTGYANTQNIDGRTYCHVTRTFEYLLIGYWDSSKNGGLCKQWET